MCSKFIFVTGGVVSGIGKGLFSASLGKLLQSSSYKVTIQKLDPYLNLDAGTMSPYQHGEVFVTDDGAETDLDLGHYERFLNISLTKKSNITTGQIYNTIIKKERRGDYLGATVQVIPHVTDMIKHRILEVSYKFDITIVEVGGTVGDIESLPFLEAIRQMRNDFGKENVMYVHVALLPFIASTDELKTKPIQHSVNELRRIGINPDMICVRTPQKISSEIKSKLSLFCDVPESYIIENIDMKYLYELPVYLERQNITEKILNYLNLPFNGTDLKDWHKLLQKIKNNLTQKCKIGIAGKYLKLMDSYLSLFEALKHAAFTLNCEVKIKAIPVDEIIEKDVSKVLKNLDGLVVPGGFGIRGFLGKLKVAQYARENNLPFLGICFGMHAVLVEYAINVCNLSKATSREIEPDTSFPLIDLLKEDSYIEEKGGTMRCGLHSIKIKKNSRAFRIYQNTLIKERHRHRYALNNDYIEILEKNGLCITGVSKDNRNIAEIIEIKQHPWFLAVQFHPEFISRPLQPHPLFVDFIDTCLKLKKGRDNYVRKKS